MKLENDSQSYPKLKSLGISIHREEKDAPPGVDWKELYPILKREGLAEAWAEWGRGITVSVNGIYPWDIEDFLNGRPNLD